MCSIKKLSDNDVGGLVKVLINVCGGDARAKLGCFFSLSRSFYHLSLLITHNIKIQQPLLLF